MAEGNLRKLRPEPSAPTPTEVAAIGFSFSVDLGRGRAMVLQTHVAGDCSTPELNAAVDKLQMAGDRARARYEIENGEKEIRVHRKIVAQFTKDIAALEAKFAGDKVRIEGEAEKLGAEQTKVRDDAYQAHVDSGRRGDFELKGHQGSRVKGLLAGIDEKQKELHKAEEEHKKAIADLQKHIDDENEEIALIEEDNRRKAALLGPANE